MLAIEPSKLFFMRWLSMSYYLKSFKVLACQMILEIPYKKKHTNYKTWQQTNLTKFKFLISKVEFSSSRNLLLVVKPLSTTD